MTHLTPMLADNTIPKWEDVTYPMLSSFKKDGIRCEIVRGELFTRTMKPQVNRNLPTYLREAVEFSRDTKTVLDGELYDHTKPFNWHQSTFRSFHKPIPRSARFELIDAMPEEVWFDNALCRATPFVERCEYVRAVANSLPHVVSIDQVMVYSAHEAEVHFNIALSMGFEGSMLRDPAKGYKHDRTTVRENWLIKFKDWIEYDAVLIDVEEGVSLIEGAAAGVSPTGYMERSCKQEDRAPSGMMGAFVLRLEDGTVTRAGTWKGLTHEMRREYLHNKDKYIGRWVRFKGQRAGVKDKPRIPKDLKFTDRAVEFRDDK